MNTKLKRNKGFTLVEIVVSLTVLAVAVFGIMASFVASERFISRSSRRLQAANLSRQFFEILKTQVSADPAQGTMLNLTPWTNCGIGLGALGASPFNATCTYEVVAVGVTNEARRVTVKVNWTEP